MFAGMFTLLASVTNATGMSSVAPAAEIVVVVPPSNTGICAIFEPAGRFT